MTGILSELLGILPETILATALVFSRIAGAVSVLPAFGEQAVSTRIKLGAAIAFTILVGPLNWGDAVDKVADGFNLVLLASETLVGLLVGLSLRILIIALQVAGTIASQAISLSQIFGAGVGPEPQPAYSSLLVIAGLAFAAMAGLHVKVVLLFSVSYDVFPMGGLSEPSRVAEWGVRHVAQMFAIGLTLAAPFVLAATIYNLSLGFISRAMPQLMVAFVGAPAISLAGLVLFMLAAPIMITIWYQIFDAQLLSPDLAFR